MQPEYDSYQPVKNYNTFVSEQRYSFARVAIGGTEAFLKQANTPEVAPKLQRELLWHDYMSDFATAQPELCVRSPRVIKTAENQILFELIEAPFVGTIDNAASLESRTPRLAKLLLAMDAFGAIWHPSRHPDAATDNAPYDAVDKSWRKWAANPTANGVITETMIQDAEDILQAYRQRLKPQMQHGDFNPWHIFDKDGEWIIFDGENSSVNKARFYDLAYFYSRVFTRAQNRSVPTKLLTEFVNGVDMSEADFLESFLPLLTSRSLGIFLDAEHDKPTVDYTDSAIELFARCKSRSLSALTEI